MEEDAEENPTKKEEPVKISDVIEKSQTTEQVRVVGAPFMRGAMHLHQKTWHMLKCNLCVYPLLAWFVIFVPSFAMWVVMVMTEIDCNGFLVRLGVRNPYNNTGIYSSCDAAPESLVQLALDQFFFCVQTITSVGYGVFSPYGLSNTLVSGLFGCVGFTWMAVYSGMVFTRYSMVWKTALVAHSCHAVITTFHGTCIHIKYRNLYSCLSWRILNTRHKLVYW